MCKVPHSAKIIGIYGRRYSELLPSDLSQNNLPSSWKALRMYFNHLCELDVLMYSDSDWKNPGSAYFAIISKVPYADQYG